MAGDADFADLPFRYSPEAEDEPAITIIEGVAWTKGVRPRALDPLNEVVDVDTVSSLFGGASPHHDLQLTFRYEGYKVTVEPDQVWVTLDPESRSAPGREPARDGRRD